MKDNWDNSNDPQFVDVSITDPGITDRPDLRLAKHSPAKDRGGWLTSVTSETNRGTTFRVADANYFTDGWGVIDGDRIQLQGQDITATIASIDYASNTITLDRELKYTQGQGVALAYEGRAPEPGAFELLSS